jgi:SUKH-4 immunity protein
MTPEEFAEHWRFNSLARLPEDAANPGIPEETFRFLKETGLPVRTPLGTRFSNLNQGFSDESVFVSEEKKYLKLGYPEGEYGECFAIDFDGCVYSVAYPYQENTMRYIHKDILSFAVCLLIFTDQCVIIPRTLFEKTINLMNQEDFDPSDENPLFYIVEHQEEVTEMIHRIDPTAGTYWDMPIWEHISGGFLEEARCVGPEELTGTGWPEAARHFVGNRWSPAFWFLP